MIDIGVDRPGHSLRTVVFQAMKSYESRVLLGLLCDEDCVVSTAAARELQARGGASVFEQIVPLMSDKRGRVREAAAFVLGQFEFPEHPFASRATPLLQARLRDDPSASVRATAAAALGHLRARSALSDLMEASRDTSPGVRSAVAFALTKFPRSARAKSCLLQLAKDRSKQVRDWATLQGS